MLFHLHIFHIDYHHFTLLYCHVFWLGTGALHIIQYSTFYESINKTPHELVADFCFEGVAKSGMALAYHSCSDAKASISIKKPINLNSIEPSFSPSFPHLLQPTPPHCCHNSWMNDDPDAQHKSIKVLNVKLNIFDVFRSWAECFFFFIIFRRSNKNCNFHIFQLAHSFWNLQSRRSKLLFAKMW